MFVYKLCREVDGKMLSINPYKDGWELEYKIGESLALPCGSGAFAFETFADAMNCVWIPDERVLLLCEVEKVERGFYLGDAYTEFHLFWSDYNEWLAGTGKNKIAFAEFVRGKGRGGPGYGIMKAEKGIVLCRDIKPIKVLARFYDKEYVRVDVEGKKK